MPPILIVDDDAGIRKILHMIFDQGSGFNGCLEASNGAEAIAETKQKSPSLVILDYALPDMTGLQLAQKLKAIAPRLPIFLLTAGNDTEIEKDALSCGITAVFSKLDDLKALVANARAVCGIQ